MLPQIVCPLALLLVSLPSIVALSWTYKFRSYEPKACFYVNIPDVTQKLSFYFNVRPCSLPLIPLSSPSAVVAR